MADKWIGVLALAVLAGFVSYAATASVQSQTVSARAPAMLAQAAGAVTASDAANKLCPKPSATEGYQPAQSKALWFPAKYSGYVETYSNGEYSGQVVQLTNLYGKSCSEKNEKARIYIISHCVAPEKCHADRYEDEAGKMHDIQDAPLPKGDCFLGVCSAAASPTVLQPSSQPVISPDPAAPATPQTPPAQAAQNDIIQDAYKPTQPASMQGQQPTGQPQSQPSGQTYAQIREAGGGGTGSGQPSQTTFPGQTQTTPTVQTSGPAFQQGGFYTPGNTNTGGLLSGSSPGGYYSPSPGPRAQTTFNNPRFSSPRSGGRVASSFISGFASLVGGLFSVPGNSVVNYIQSFVGGSPQQQQQTADNQNGGQQQNTNVPGQVIVVVPYPMPTSRNTVGTQLPLRPTSTSDAYAELRELARQANGATGTAVPTGTQEDRITSAFSGQEEQVRPGMVPGENQNANGESGATPAGERQGGLALSVEQMGTTSVSEEKATSTHATSTSYKEPKVVEIGIPVDITDLGSYEAVLAYLKGDWARTEHTALQNKVALAQAEVQQDAIRAQIEALQDARAANICDDSCAASLTVLQNELPVLQSRVQALQTAVEKDAQPRPSSPPPTVAQINRVAESLAEPTYETSVPRSAASAPTAVSVSEQEALPEVPQTKSEAIVTRVVQSVWNFLKSIFLPPATESAKPRPSCSLFASLFGKCK